MVGLRPPPGISSAWLMDQLAETLAPLDAAAREEGGAVRLEHDHELAPLLTAADTPLEHLLRPHAADPHSGGAPFGTDGGNLTALGAAPLIFGPGSIDVAHRPDEYIPAQDLLRAADMIERVARARCLEPT